MYKLKTKEKIGGMLALPRIYSPSIMFKTLFSIKVSPILSLMAMLEPMSVNEFTVLT